MRKTVFWSWQSDLPPDITRHFVKEALNQALKKVNAELELEQAERIELDHDTKGEAGMVEIAKTIFEKIEDCEVFVADITPIAEVQSSETGKKVPNPNVMIELGYALHELGHKRIITVANLAFGGKPEDLPFDLRHRRGAITFTLHTTEDKAYEKQMKLLVKQLVNALKVNLEAPREDRMVRNPRPVLSLRAGKGMPCAWIVEQSVNLDDLPSIDDIKIATSIKSKNDMVKSEFSFADSIFGAPIGMGFPKRLKPFNEWNQEELDGYNSQVLNYYEKYKAYLEAVKEHRLLRQRTIEVKVEVANSGTLPASDIRSSISFPPNVLVYESDNLPSPPVPPLAPPLAPYGHRTVTIVQSGNSYFAELLEKPTRIGDDHQSIKFRLPKVQQDHYIEFRPFTLLFPSVLDIKSFDANYYITADELPLRTNGIMTFEVKLAESD